MKPFRHLTFIACASMAFLHARAQVDPFMTTDQMILDQGSPERLIRKQPTFPAEYDLSFSEPAPTNEASRQYQDGSVSLNFDRVPVHLVIDVFARLQGLDAQIDGILTNRITLKSPEPLPLNEALDLMEKAIRANGVGFTIEQKVLKVREERP